MSPTSLIHHLRLCFRDVRRYGSISQLYVVRFASWCYASAALAVMRCLSLSLCVCPSRSCIVSKRINISSNFFHRRVATSFQFFFCTKRHGNILTAIGSPSVYVDWKISVTLNASSPLYDPPLKYIHDIVVYKLSYITQLVVTRHLTFFSGSDVPRGFESSYLHVRFDVSAVSRCRSSTVSHWKYLATGRHQLARQSATHSTRLFGLVHRTTWTWNAALTSRAALTAQYV